MDSIVSALRANVVCNPKHTDGIKNFSALEKKDKRNVSTSEAGCIKSG